MGQTEIFEDRYTESQFEREGVFMADMTPPDWQQWYKYCKPIKLERRLVDYFYERRWHKKDSHTNWAVVVKYGSKKIYLNATLEDVSKWFFSDSICISGGHAWEYKNRKSKHSKYRNKPKE